MNDVLNEALRGDDMLSEIEEGSELYEHIRMTVDPGQQPERIDTYLTNHLSNISRNRVQNAAKAGNILVNDKSVKSNYKVKPNDVISIVFTYPPRETDIKPEEPLRIPRPSYRQRHHGADDRGQKRSRTSRAGAPVL